MKIYSKKGDTGETSLFGGARVTKAHLRIEAYGQVDELNAALGVVLALENQQPSKQSFNLTSLLQPVQQELFVLGSHLATQYDTKDIPDTLPTLDAQAVDQLESQIDKLSKDLAPLETFIIPGGTTVAAQLHMARTVCRRAERAVVRLAAEEELLPDIAKYLNRLSDFLFILARASNQAADEAEQTWQK
ncbi:cob(I)yrinic acid a,c-diamide adenosyltransferase [Patescibacteria group bacterium]